MNREIGDLINAVEVIFMTAQRRGDVFNFFAQRFRKANSMLKELNKGNGDAEVLLGNMESFIKVAEVVHKYHASPDDSSAKERGI